MIDEYQPVIEFTANDRCDQCGAQAYSLSRREDMKSGLLFCIHHRREHMDALLDDGWEIVDDYEAIDRLTSPHVSV